MPCAALLLLLLLLRSMVFSANDSPFAGRAGKAVTGRVIGERLTAQAESSVSLTVTQLQGEGGGGLRWCMKAPPCKRLTHPHRKVAAGAALGTDEVA